MAVGPDTFPAMPAIAGIRLGTAHAGIRKSEADDLTVIELAPGTAVAATFTRNAFCAAPVRVAREHLAHGGDIRWLVINAGNANAGTGTEGLAAARATCAALAELTGGTPRQVLPFSTGVIGEPLPVVKLTAALPAALARLDAAGWEAAARAIMTTDTRPKGAAATCSIEGRPVTVAGIAKGSGMIAPNMATMLAYVGTDARVDPAALQTLLREAVAVSFNAITVDGDTSTNDACVLMATGQAGTSPLAPAHPDWGGFAAAVTRVCRELAEAIVRDGEGATKLIRIRVEQAADQDEARRVGFTVANSPLVKTAFFAGDPNWGRILAAVGRAGIEGLDIGRVEIWLDAVRIVRAGGRDPDYTEAAGQQVMARDEIGVRILLGRGQAGAEILTCDLSYDYVRINAEYRT
ncbi:glutamate N-acetyltransferase/amino-acid N-acetyltransferase [Methylomarinovum caldicuralii]|uniref:Arginine biosynthesis bifunctional protein ArgJ n=1 Tax=Methylomarinovum caldicuralii TaxID=438856 RepID=A0AAU9C4M6_9GAMM|nr:bifunctional glutamate N-acetyltransferase/amino-acid acetyltransferase ArgJ [Methylomarinovum caldicuralii]BCX80774.1 glutamate N-acetyltransferase/amino-acid N-acetyltransferase [Methylomarinovum caldicuralii]